MRLDNCHSCQKKISMAWKKFPCWSQIPSYVSKVGSGINMENSNPHMACQHCKHPSCVSCLHSGYLSAMNSWSRLSTWMMLHTKTTIFTWFCFTVWLFSTWECVFWMLKFVFHTSPVIWSANFSGKTSPCITVEWNLWRKTVFDAFKCGLFREVVFAQSGLSMSSIAKDVVYGVRSFFTGWSLFKNRC